MTLKQLAARLNQIIEDNQKRGVPERNDEEIVVRLKRDTKYRVKDQNRFFTFKFVEGGSLTVHDQQFGVSISVREADEILPKEAAL